MVEMLVQPQPDPCVHSTFNMTRYFFILFFFFVIIPYEFLGINEDFLFLISFSIFFYNLVNILSGYIQSELDSRRSYLRNLFEILLDFNGFQLSKLHSFFDYIRFQDLEFLFVSSYTYLLNQFYFRIHLNKFLGSSIPEYSSIEEFEHVLVQISSNIDSEETCYSIINA